MMGCGEAKESPRDRGDRDAGRGGRGGRGRARGGADRGGNTENKGRRPNPKQALKKTEEDFPAL